MSSTDEKLFSVHFRPVFCILLSNLKRDVYGSSLVVSAFFGLLGSILQLFLWKGYLKEHDTRQKPSSHPHVVFNLALATALSCLTTIVIGLSLLFVPIPSQHGMISSHISPQGFYGIFPVEVLCDFGYIAAALWTLIYLIDVCLQVHKVFCRILIYYLFGWGFAAIFTVLIEVFKFAESFEIRYPLQTSLWALFALKTLRIDGNGL